MTNPNHDPEDRELATLSCPCEQQCCSTVLTSPKGFITIIFWDCQSMTEQDMDDDLTSLMDILTGEDEDDDDAAETS